MTKFRGRKEAFGKPGIEPRWTHGSKDGVGTAYSGDSLVWFTIWSGCLTEVYYPTIDTPQIRDLQYLITDGKTFFREEKKHLYSQTERLNNHALGYRITNFDPEKDYRIVKEVISVPHLPCVIQHTKLEGDPATIESLQLYALCAPHLQIGGKHNNAYVIEVGGKKILAAEKQGVWLALVANIPFSKLSCGYVGKSDGWTDLADNFQMDWEFDLALDGNVALTGQIEMNEKREWTLALAFGLSLQNVISTLFQSLAFSFDKHKNRFIQQWERSKKNTVSIHHASKDGGKLYCVSQSLLMAHEDKTFPGALIASLSIPWGEAKGDKNLGGYHLVWTRDLVQSAMGMLAFGNKVTPLRTLIYLAASQGDDGSFPQNFWVDGKYYLQGLQLDEVAFPILLAYRLDREKALEDFDPYVLVKRGAYFLIRHAPITGQDRWEESISGYSPATLAVIIAALICAASFATARQEQGIADYFSDYADFLESHIEQWTITTEGTLCSDVKRHFVRINPAGLEDQYQKENAEGTISLPNYFPRTPNEFPIKEIVDPGFLELVRYGIRKPDDPLIIDSLRVVDHVLKVETPYGPTWRRYTHDGYGQRHNGGPFITAGKGRAWPLLTGERGHYALAAGQDPSPYIQAIEGFAGETGLIPEQVWDEPDLPKAYMFLGQATGAASPLAWAHAEYIRLLRSVSDGQIFDKISEVEERYVLGKKPRKQIEIWEHKFQTRKVKKGSWFRIQALAPFRLHWTLDHWQTTHKSQYTHEVFDIKFIDISIPYDQTDPLIFTFFWIKENQWEGVNHEIIIESA